MRRKLTDEQKAEFRARFLAAAQDLFAAQGVAGVTMRQIAQAVGYSQTAAYSYFKNKDEILAQVRAAALHRFCDALDAALESADARSNARGVGAAYLKFAIDEPNAYRLIFSTDQPQALKYPVFSKAMRRATVCMTRYVSDLVETGYLAGDPEHVGRIFWAAAHGVVALHQTGLVSRRARDRLHKDMMHMLARGNAG